MNRIKTEWIASDDFQRIRRISETRFELIDVSEARGKYFITKPDTVDITEYYDGNRYTNEAAMIIKSFYSGGISEFESGYSNAEDRMQVLAEMIYETKSSLSDVIADTADEVEKIIDRYTMTGLLSM